MAPRLRVALWAIGSVPLVLTTAFIPNPVLTGPRDSWCIRQLPDDAETTPWEQERSRGRRRALSSTSRGRDGASSVKEEESTRHGIVGVGIRKVLAAITAAAVAYVPGSALGASRAQVSTTEPEITAQCFIEVRLRACLLYTLASSSVIFGVLGGTQECSRLSGKGWPSFETACSHTP